MIDTIIQSFDVWTNAQGVKSKGRVKSIDNIRLEGIARLRELILELAVRGKLVSQSPNDEPASELLKKAGKEKKLRNKTDKDNVDTIEDVPYEIPIGWEWCQFVDIVFQSNVGLDKGKDLQNESFSFKYFKMNNIGSKGQCLFDPITRINASAEEVAKYNLSPGDFLFNTRNSRELVGKTCVFRNSTNEVFLFNNNILRATFILPISPDYINFWFCSPIGNGILQKFVSSTTNVAAIYQKQLNRFAIPIPPSSEQKRIVAKVDELMVLCDKLEEKQTRNLKTHQLLVKTLLETLTQAKDADELKEAWQRLYPHFDKLFCTEDSIDQLKQSILQLGVMGRLVKQDPKDEPASEIIKKIEKVKAKLVNEGKIKKEKPLPAITEQEKFFSIPPKWEWVRLGDITNYGTSPKAEPGDVEDSTWILELEDVEKCSSKLLTKTRVGDRKFQSSKNRFYKGDVVYGKLRPYLDKVLIADEDGICTTEMIPVRGYLNVLPEYLRLVMKSSYFIDYATSSTHGMNLPRLGTDKARMALLPLTSEAEQRRIVVKVNQLTALCDELKDRINKSQEIQNSLSQTIVESAIAENKEHGNVRKPAHPKVKKSRTMNGANAVGA